jgi:hypothetical protein
VDDAEGDWSGGKPRRDKLVTEYPSKVARLQIVWPKKPVPPNTKILPFLEKSADIILSV